VLEASSRSKTTAVDSEVRALPRELEIQEHVAETTLQEPPSQTYVGGFRGIARALLQLLPVALQECTQDKDGASFHTIEVHHYKHRMQSAI